MFPIGTVFWIGDGLGRPHVGVGTTVVGPGDARRLRGRASPQPGMGGGIARSGRRRRTRLHARASRAHHGGGLTGETLPIAVLPWTVLPLVLYATGRLPRRTALVASAATVPFMGGQNATEVLATLVLPRSSCSGSRGSWRARAASLLPWSGLVLVASLWWLVPLFVLGRYSPPFLDYIESARNTTGVLGWFAALRGTDHWVAFLPGGSTSGWVAGAELVVAPCSCSRRRWRARRPRRTDSAPAAVPCRARALPRGRVLRSDGGQGGVRVPFRPAWLDLLDGPLAPFRNVHKFDPLVRLPVSLGLACGSAPARSRGVDARASAGVRPACGRWSRGRRGAGHGDAGAGGPVAGPGRFSYAADCVERGSGATWPRRAREAAPWCSPDPGSGSRPGGEPSTPRSRCSTLRRGRCATRHLLHRPRRSRSRTASRTCWPRGSRPADWRAC